MISTPLSLEKAIGCECRRLIRMAGVFCRFRQGGAVRKADSLPSQPLFLAMSSLLGKQERIEQKRVCNIILSMDGRVNVDATIMAVILDILRQDKQSADRTNARLGDTVFYCKKVEGFGGFEGYWGIEGRPAGEGSFVFKGLGKSRDEKLTLWVCRNRPEEFL